MHRLLRCSLEVVVCLSFAGRGAANPIDPGFDLFFTPDDGTSIVDLSGIGLGLAPLKGVPLPGAPGDADTIVERLDPGPLAGGTGIIDIELVALHLVSSSPIDLTPLGGPFVGVFSDLHITLDRVGLNLSFNVFLPNSLGTMNILHPLNVHTGGSFSACFGGAFDPNCLTVGGGVGTFLGGIFTQASFLVPGGDLNNPLDFLINLAAPQVSLGSLGNWVHIPRQGAYPSGNFVVNSITHSGPHPAQPLVPEPSTALLFGVGLIALLASARKLTA